MSQYQDNRQDDQDSGKIDIMRYLDRFRTGFKHFWWIILPCMAVIAVFNCLRMNPSQSEYYEAAGTYTINADIGGYSSSYTDKSTAQQMAVTFQNIMSTSMMNDIIAEDLGAETADISAYSIRAEVVANTNLLTIYVTGKEGGMAEQILKSLVNNYQDVAEYIIGRTRMTAVDEAVTYRNVTYMPDYKSAVKNGIKKGGLIGLALIVIYSLLRRTILNGRDIQEQLNQHVIGTLPTASFKKNGRKNSHDILVNNRNLTIGYRDAVSAARVHLLHRLRSINGKSFLVTSTLPGEGKTTTAVNLALALAQLNKKVILIDCDFRLGNVAKTLGIKDKYPGILEVLNNKATLDEALIFMDNLPLSVLICSGGTNKAPEYASSRRMQSLLEQLEEEADYVVLDTPPAAGMADAMEFTAYVDGIVYVIKQDHAHAAVISEAMESLSGNRSRMLGCILNMADKHAMTGSSSGYSYREYGGYGKYSRYGSGYGYRSKEE